MPFGINIRASGYAAPFWALVDQAASLEVQPTIRALAYAPHITLAKYDVDAGEITTAVDALAKTPSLSLTFDKLGSFDPGFLILWAAPRPTQALLELHACTHAFIDPSRCKLPYRPGHWTPHCSIALRVADNRHRDARRLLASKFKPFTLTFDVVDGVASPPITILAERALANGADQSGLVRK
ncbi:2'-5' RNA ligase family protein [Qipengyuania sp. GH1]|uniref:2'-5' RNA ligase family protein n=1 Tax=Qipengyuania aestuarii TaxID=2867241 RepID=UPI001C86BE38|nr:2'-5' RNA ligase family protein [Qipengyuania aestuarii]MBX7535124.1 2'-5' RNA ligase family protein [Qipengyuania aestuarii]